SLQKNHRDLLTAEEVMRLSPSRLLIYRTGYPVIRANKNFWFKQSCYRKCLHVYGIKQMPANK
ncbi:MAG: type IV secretory system conjugative DNA transfer family protein, partial [Gammaproteobacteria bacterium]|nr:type IV secretory system conjugative DNA transfer family protein [Gammaproteobacteria bacterium]